MFSKILIANRGEIACRIIETCRRLGIETIGVYSQVDAGARHVRMADHSACIGPAAPAESYLNIERIIAVARAHGAQAIHPGYGFLSENASFARAVEEAELVLIGPKASTMEIMGSKAAAKAHLESAGVPLIPGYHGDDQTDDELADQALKIGFPLMLKAAAGGGGKGMRVVRKRDELSGALAAARREAAGAFGDEQMILERFLERPRHIEAQILADRHGNTVHLFERDCSSQRRHQKIIEEAPASNLDEDLRTRLLDAAVRAAEAVNYEGAGTVEFLVDGDEFFFLEMNTRLQVEHPVTEMITGQDLVEWQIRVAAGEALPLKQAEIKAGGHAMEARIYAEDPERGFVPSSGEIRALSFPEGAQLRLDRGVDEGDAVSVHYDPMIAKVIVHGPDRETCRKRLLQALSASFIAGPATNLAFLQRLADLDAFRTGTLDTGLLDREPGQLEQASPPQDVIAAACAFLLMEEEKAVADPSPWSMCDGWRVGETAARSLDIECGQNRHQIEARGTDGCYELQVGENKHRLQLSPVGLSRYLLISNRQSTPLWIFSDSTDRLELCWQGQRWTVIRHPRFDAAEAASVGDGLVLAPMPGKVLDIRVANGDAVGEGDTLLIMEAMKMELSIKAPMDGTVENLTASTGELVEADTPLLTVVPNPRD